MTNLLGMAELPLTILAWMLVGMFGAGLLFAALVVVLAVISEYQEEKQRVKWDELIRGVRK